MDNGNGPLHAWSWPFTVAAVVGTAAVKWPWPSMRRPIATIHGHLAGVVADVWLCDGSTTGMRDADLAGACACSDGCEMLEGDL